MKWPTVDFLSFSHPSLTVIWSFPPSVKVGRMVITADQQPPCGFQADIAYTAETSSNICSNNGNKFYLFISAECLAQISVICGILKWQFRFYTIAPNYVLHLCTKVIKTLKSILEFQTHCINLLILYKHKLKTVYLNSNSERIIKWIKTKFYPFRNYLYRRSLQKLSIQEIP